MNNLKKIRTARGMSQAEVARALNISRQAYYNYETGKREADYETLLKLGELFGCSVEEIISQKENSQDDDILTAFPDLKDFYGDDVPAFFSQHDLTEWIDILIKLDEEQLKQLHQYAEFLNHQKSD